MLRTGRERRRIAFHGRVRIMADRIGIDHGEVRTVKVKTVGELALVGGKTIGRAVGTGEFQWC